VNGKRGWNTTARVVWLVAWMALIAIGFTLSTPPTKAAMPPCALSGTTEDAATAQDTAVQVCSLVPAASLAGPETRESAPDVAAPATAGGPTYEFFQ